MTPAKLSLEINSREPSTAADSRKPSLALSVAQCKCSRCRRGDMFIDSNPYHLKRILKMNQYCPVCGQPLDIEVGFYYGTSYVSYAITLATSGFTFLLWWAFLGISANDNRIFYWLIANGVLLLLLQPYFMRLARAGWLAFFVHYDPEWSTKPPEKPERTNQGLSNAW